MLVVGPTGAGKSVLLAFMALQFRRYAGAQVFAFDFGGSIRAATLAMGGDWHDLGGGLAGRDHVAPSLQPLARIDEAGERAWAAEWLAGLLAREGVAVGPEIKELLWSALASLASAPVGERTLTGLAVLLQSSALKQALQPYTLDGPWGRLLDGDHEALGSGSVQAFETEGLIGSGAAAAVLAYLFHRIGDRLTGAPTMIIVDEGWLALGRRRFRRTAARVAEDAAQEECERDLRHAEPRRHRRLAQSRPRSSRAARRGCSWPTSARSSRRSAPSTAASASTTARSRSSRAPRPSATIIARAGAATGCSSWGSAKSRSR